MEHPSVSYKLAERTLVLRISHFIYCTPRVCVVRLFTLRIHIRCTGQLLQ